MLRSGKRHKGKGMGVPEENIMQQLQQMEGDREGRRIGKTDVRA
jgi:hypothetical protein